MRLLFAAIFALNIAFSQTPGGDEEAVGFPPIDAPVTDPALLEARTMALGRTLRCPVCQGLSVADSSSEAAVAMKDRIRDLVAKGYTDEQIVDYFIQRYGAWILLEPPRQGVNWLIFAGPVALLLVGGAVVATFARRSPPAPAAPPAPARDDYARRVLDELER